MNSEKALFQYWENMRSDKYFIKGKINSLTKKQVLASNNGNQFGPGSCYWAKVEDLPDGTYYIDGESPITTQ